MADDMSANKRTVREYMDGFNRTDHAAVLSCLTEDVEWVIPGMFHATGKAAFDKEIENDAFVGSPTIRVSRMTEEATSSWRRAACARPGGTAARCTRSSVTCS